MKTKKCLNCNKRFSSYYHFNQRKYCSLNCSNEGRKIIGTKVLLKCIVCGKSFYVKNNRKNTAKYCSNKCKDNMQKGHKHPHWKGGKRLQGGYIYIWQPHHPNATRHGYVLEHRLVMEKHIKRFLEPTEIVHHKNGITTDNRFQNLELLKNQSVHSSNLIHPRIRDTKGHFLPSQ